ncbi:MAG: HAD family hydrolase [Candidatus Acidiferrales bacterium]
MANPRHFSARAVLFDWDGTLLNSYRADSRAYLIMFRKLEIQWTLEDLARHYSPNWFRVYRAARLHHSKWKKADRLWGAAYQAQRPPLLAGARRVIESLHGRFVLGIVTSGSGRRVRRQLREFGLRRYFSAIVCHEDSPTKKPHPAPLRKAMARIHARPENCVYIGDTAEDIEMARRAGVRPIGVFGPFPTAARLRAAKPDALLRSVRELPRILRPMDHDIGLVK